MGFCYCVCVYVCVFGKETLFVKSPRSISQHLCSVALRDTLILLNTFC